MIDQTDGRERKVQATKPAPRAESQYQYIYHWDRIVGALAAFGLLIGLIGFGLYTWLRPSLPPAGVGLDEVQGLESTPQQPAGKDAAVDSPRLAADEALPHKSPVPPALADTAPVQKIPVGEEAASPPLTQELVREEVAEAAAAPMPSAESDGGEQPNMGQGPLGEDRPEPSSAVSPDTPVGVGSESASEPGPGGDTAMADSLDETSEEGHPRSGTTSITSSAVKRFVLAQSVTNNEPKGNLGDIIPNTRGVAEVYSYSEVIGLEGEVLEYRWLHEGEQVLKIRVPVGAERWRSHSTKRIYPKMKGAWRAELRDSAGNLLASIDFVY